VPKELDLNESKSLTGKVALITGAASGIGRASALACADAGAAVVISDVDAVGAEQTVDLIRKAGGDASFVRTDVSKPAEVDHLLQEIIKRHGRIDIAHNNAGIESQLAPTAEADEADFDRTIAINLKGVWLCMRAEIREMLKSGGGSIINTSSVGGLSAVPGAGSYAAAKHGVVGLTRTAAVEYAKAGIRVNAICPGLTKTRMTDKLSQLDPALIASVMPPMGRMAATNEIAEAVVFLASSAASYLTGHALAVDGGSLAV
jgi:NAD(P)-dependent dehydrogenase (short-subunit alcohol dehydrogenase family)